jgi:hypothetical protein
MTGLLVDTATTEGTTPFFPFLTSGLTPASASTITLGYAANVSGTVSFNPIVAGLVGNALQTQLPTQENFNQSFTGKFTVPSDPAQFTDGDITLDLPLISSTLGLNPNDSFVSVLGDFGISVPPSVVGALDSLGITDVNSAVGVFDQLFDYHLTGTGTLTTGTGTTNFNINYVDNPDSIVITGFDPNVVAGSLVGQSAIAAQGNFTVDLELAEFAQVTQQLGIDLPSNVDYFLALAQSLGINELPLASGAFNLEATTVPLSTASASSLFPVAVPI